MATTLEVLTASQVAMLLNPPMVNLLTTTYSLTHDPNTYFAVTFTTQLSKSGNITWSSGTNPSRVTAVVPGTYLVTGTVIWPSNLSTAIGRARVAVNGATSSNIYFATQNGSSGNFAASLGGLVVLNAGDYVEIYANQNTASNFTLTSVQFGMNLVSLATS